MKYLCPYYTYPGGGSKRQTRKYKRKKRNKSRKKRDKSRKRLDKSGKKRDKSGKKRDKSRKRRDKKKQELEVDYTIESNTPIEALKESKKIYQSLKHDIDPLEKLSTDTIASIRSFSPKINRELVSLKTRAATDVFKCGNDLLQTNIGSQCLDYTSKRVQTKLLNNLRSSKHLDCSLFIAPKQYNSNCWFNTFFVTFFFSDKGRKFFRFFRQLMITGKKVDGTTIPDRLARIFFVFNKVIEASYNQDGNSNYKLISNYNTNYFIETIYNILLERNIVTYKKNQSGNPLEYYLAIIQYLNYNAVNIATVDIYGESDFKSINTHVQGRAPEIIIAEIIDADSKKIRNRPLEFTISVGAEKHRYKLDAAIIRDTSQQHFCSVLTCNGDEYSFDGASFSRLSQYNWTAGLNKPVKWGFQGHTLKWSFMNGYQMLFYYRI